jgi:hypothetical protein
VQTELRGPGKAEGEQGENGEIEANKKVEERGS